MFDYLLKGGRVIDPVQEIDGIMDLAIKDGKICLLKREIEESEALNTINVKGKLIMPGLIDLHTHIYWGGTSLGINPNDVGPKTGVTTFVDAGSSGPGNFLGFKEHIIETSICDIFAFLNISYAGIPYFSSEDFSNPNMYGENQALEMIKVQSVINIVEKFPAIIKGIKVRLGMNTSGNLSLIPLQLAMKAAELTGKPVMVHIDEAPPTVEQLISCLREKDIITHSFKGGTNKFTNKNGEVLSELLEARERGVVVDIGHGVASFSFKVATEMLKNNFYPDTISTDLHALSIKKAAFDLPTTMSKFINLGMPLDKVVYACTYSPAVVIGEEKEIGHLKIGSKADIAIFELKEGNYEFYDPDNVKLEGKFQLFPVMTFKDGKLIYNSEN